MAKTFMKLTRPAMRKLPLGEKRIEHGMIFERLMNGDGVLTVNVVVNGQRIHRVIGRESDGTTRTQAEAFIEKAHLEAREGRLNFSQGRKIALGLRGAASRYIERLVAEGGQDLVPKRRRLTLHLVPFFGDLPFSNLSTFDVERYKKARLGEGTKAGTINRKLAALSHLLTKAIEWRWLDKQPALLKRLPENRRRIVYLTVGQVQRLVTAARQDQNPHIYPFVVIGLETSMRKSEILSIRREHVDILRRAIYIPKARAGTRE